MPDLWDDWDRLVKHCGRPHRVASDLTDVELVRLLATETHGRSIERRLLGEELYARLNRGAEQAPQRAPPPRIEEATWPTLGPEVGP